MDDDRLLSSLRRIAEPVEPAADFIDRLYESLADELGFHGKPAQSPVHWLGRRGRPRSQRMRVSLWLAAAVLLALALIGGVALVGAVLEDRKPPSVRNGLIAIGRDDGILLLDPTTGTTVRRLETPLPFVTSITWAPDGQQLAFNVEVDFDGNPSADPSPGGVWVMDVSEGTSKQLLHCGAGPDACGVAWSPDGSSLAVTHGPRLELIDPDSGEATVLENFRQGVFSPTWSPDSSRIAVSLFDGVLTAVSLDGSARITLSRLPDIGGAIWSPDGSTFAYLPGTEAQCPEASNAEECAGQYDITIMLLRLATNTPEKLGSGGSLPVRRRRRSSRMVAGRHEVGARPPAPVRRAERRLRTLCDERGRQRPAPALGRARMVAGLAAGPLILQLRTSRSWSRVPSGSSPPGVARTSSETTISPGTARPGFAPRCSQL